MHRHRVWQPCRCNAVSYGYRLNSLNYTNTENGRWIFTRIDKGDQIYLRKSKMAPSSSYDIINLYCSSLAMLPCPDISRGSVLVHSNVLVFKGFQCEQYTQLTGLRRSWKPACHFIPFLEAWAQWSCLIAANKLKGDRCWYANCGGTLTWKTQIGLLWSGVATSSSTRALDHINEHRISLLVAKHGCPRHVDRAAVKVASMSDIQKSVPNLFWLLVPKPEL